MYLSKSCNRTSILSNKCCSKTNNIVNFNPKEKYYQKIIEELLKGKHKVLKSGITDVTNEDTHAEIKHWSKWKFLVGQLLSYNNCDYKPNLHAYMFGHYSETNKIIALEVFEKYDIIPFEFVIDSNKQLLINLVTKKIVFKNLI